MPSPDETAERLARIESALQVLLEQAAHIPRLSEGVALMHERDSVHNKRIDILFEEVSETAGTVKQVDAKVEKWINRGIGAYAVSTVLFGIVVTLLVRITDNYEGIIRNTNDMVVTLDRRVSWLEFESRGRSSADDKKDGKSVR